MRPASLGIRSALVACLAANGEKLTSRPPASYQGYLPFIWENSHYGWRATFGAEITC